MKFRFLSNPVALVVACSLVAALAAPAWSISFSTPVGLTGGEDFTDDAEEHTVGSDDTFSKPPGTTLVDSSDIEMGQEENGGAAKGCVEGVDCAAANPMIAGFRFLDIPVPQGATITSAMIQFTADENDKNDFPANYHITGELSPNAETFVQPESNPVFGVTPNFNISSRPRTSSVDWSPAPWVAGEAGPAQLTPNFASIVQEIVDQPLWAPGNAMVFIIDGTRFDGFEGSRVVESQRGDGKAAVLHLEFVPEPSALALALLGMMALVSGSRSKSRDM